MEEIDSEFNIRSPADEFMKYFTRRNNHVSVKYPADKLSFQIVSRDLENRTVTMSLLGNLIWIFYKTVKATLTITLREDMSPSSMKCTLKFEKKSHGNADLSWIVQIMSTLVEYIKFIDDDLYELNHKVNSINAKYSADDCFKVFIGNFKNDADVEIEAEDGENRTATMSLRSSHSLRAKFNTLKVTTTITPKEDDDGSSHVKWTIEADKISDYINEPNLSRTTAASIRDIIDTTLI